jgi:hypothetical protein
MTRMPGRRRVAVAVCLAVILPFGGTVGLAVGQRGGTGATDATGRVYSFADLPTDPAKAGIALVDTILGSDAEAANAATIELFRRSGMPVVSAKGPVVALPDDYVLVDAAIYDEFVPWLTTSVRRGDSLSPDQFAGYMNDLGAFPGELPPSVLLGGLGTWGKDKDSGPEERTAAAAIRALSAQRGEVLFMEADAENTHLDMLQLELVLGTLSFVGRIEPANPKGLDSAFAPGGAPPTALEQLLGVRSAEAASPCEQLEKALKGPSELGYNIAWNQSKKGAKKAAGSLFTQWRKSNPTGAVQRMLDKADALKEGSKASDVWSHGSEILNILLIYLGATLDVNAKPPGLHTMPEGGVPQVEVEAKANFESTLAQGQLPCYAMVGIEVPPNKPLSGYKVHWSITQPVVGAGSGQLLQAVEGEYFGGGGNQAQITGGAGEAKVHFKVATERSPGAGQLKRKTVVVRATLDKDDFPFKLGDLLGAGKPGWALQKSWDLVVSAAKRKALPSTPENINIAYHDAESYSIKGTRTILAFYYVMPITLDLYSCDGIEGPWHGTVKFHGDIAFMGDPANQVFGNKFPPTVDQSWTVQFPMHMGPPPTIAGDIQEGRAELVGGLGGIVEMDGGWRLLDRRDGSVVGRIILTGDGGETLDTLAIWDGFDASYPIKVGAPSHCPPSGLYFP